MTRSDLTEGIASIARVMARDPQTHTELAPIFIILAESLLDIDTPPRSRKQDCVERLAKIELQMPDRPIAERRHETMTQMGISRSYYFELRAAAVEQGLVDG